MTKNRGRVTRAMCYIDTLIQCYAVTRLEYGVYTRYWSLVSLAGAQSQESH